jgi:hypothetical protein
MNTIGIRAAPGVVTFAIYDCGQRTIVNIEEIRIPAAFSIPDRLKYVRSNLLDILREFNISKAGIRAIEPLAQSPNIEKIEIEGVIQEAFASSELDGYYVGHISSITALLGIERRAFKPFVDGNKDYPVENWSKLSREQREAVLCAIGAENA